jgi:quinoprotein glucose dehydrogenase
MSLNPSTAYKSVVRIGITCGLIISTAAAQDARDGFNYETWDQYLGGHDSAQYSSLNQINRRNVDELEVAWTYSTGERGAYLFNPIVVDGVMYALAHGATIVALNAATGEEIWRKENDGRIGTRGINYWESEDGSDRRLLYLNNGLLTSIDARSGETVTRFGDNGFVDLRDGLGDDYGEVRALQTNNPGRIFEDLIIMSLPASGGSYASAPADIHAYNILTGDLEWIFHTVPRPGEFGADTWPADADDSYGGVHNWSESTVDTERGIVYIPTGTARYDFYGANRHGANLFGNSVLALNARTGERIWHFQTIHHDLWDYDLPTAPKLITIRQNGRDIPVVAQVSKQGFLFVFHRETGEPIWPIEERPVPQSTTPGEQSWPTQPFPTKPPPFARQGFTPDDINPYLPAEDRARLQEMVETYDLRGMYTPPSLQGTIMLPGHNGGANWGGTAVDPDNGLLYVASKDLPTTANLTPPQPDGRGNTQTIPGASEGFVAYTIPIDFMIQSNGLSAIGPPWSIITAYDLNEGEILWQVPNGDVAALQRYGISGTGSHVPRGGLVATAGGLLFAATSSDRMFRARDVRDGSVVWEHQLPAASEGVPAVYEVDGRQFVAIAVGGNGLFSQGLQWDETGGGHYRVFALPK